MFAHHVVKWFFIVFGFVCLGVSTVNAAEIKDSLKREVLANGLSYQIASAPKWVVKASPAPASKAVGSSMRYVLVDKQIKLEENTSTQFLHIIRSIDSPAGLELGSQIGIEFDPSFQTLVFHKLSLVRDGKNINKLTKNAIQLLQRETQLEAQIYNGLVFASILLDDVRVGDKIEYEYSLLGANPVFKNQLSYTDWAPAGNGAVDHYRFRLISPKTKPVNVVVSPKFKKTEKALPSNQIEIQVTRENIPQFNYDATAPLHIYLDEQVMVSEYHDWQGVAKWASELFEIKTSEALKLKAKQIKTASKDSKEQLLNTLQYVQTEIRYLGMEIGPNTHLPNSPDLIMKQRFGDCKDKTLLLISLLNELGIKAKPVLVSTDYRSGLSGFKLPTLLAFNHVIAKVELDDKVYWLDSTRSYQTGGLSSRSIVGLGAGLIVDENTQALAKLPDALNAKRVAVKEHVVVSQFSEDPIMESEITYFGDLAESVRNMMANLPKDKVDAAFTEEYLKYYPKLQHASLPTVVELASENALTVKQSFKMVDFWTYPEEKVLYGEVIYWNPVVSLNRPNEPNRKIPLSIQLAGLYSHEIIFDYPEEVLKTEKKNDYSDSNRIFSYQVEHVTSKNQSRFLSQLKFFKEEVSAQEWPAFFDDSLKLRKASGASMMVPVIPSDKMEQLKKEMTALDATLYKNKAVTAVQRHAHLESLFLKAQLQGNRLNKKFKAKALNKLGLDEDTVGQYESAKTHFNEAILLSPDDSTMYADAAVNAVIIGDYSLAIRHARQSLALAPSDNTVLRTLAHANYFKEDYAEAKSILIDSFEKGDSSRKGYVSIWLYLTMLRNGDSADTLIKQYLPDADHAEWPNPIMKALLDSNQYQDVLKAASDGVEGKQNLCELYYYMGERFLIDGDISKAKELFKKSVDTNIIEFSEYSMSKRRLTQLNE